MFKAAWYNGKIIMKNTTTGVLTSVSLIYMIMTCGCNILAQPMGPDNPIPLPQMYITWYYDESNDFTQINLISGKKMFLKGEFEIRPTLWGNHSLLGKTTYQHRVLNTGQTNQWIFYRNPWLVDLKSSGPTLSKDGKTCFIWLFAEKQLVGVDINTGQWERLTHLPTRNAHLADPYYRIMDPGPVWKEQGVIHDPNQNRLFFLIQEAPNDQVQFWQKRTNRGGYFIVAVDLDTKNMIYLSGPDKLKGFIHSWDISLKRKEVYIVVSKPETIIEVRSLDGILIRTLPMLVGGNSSLHLSPDEHTLLVDKKGSFTLLNLKTNQLIKESSKGYFAQWSPNSQIVTYLNNWQLWFYDVVSQENTLVAYREPAENKRFYGGGPALRDRPRWSSDGSILAVNIGGGIYEDNSLSLLDAPTLILDLRNRIATILPHAEDILLIPHPHPFRQ